MTDMKRPFWKAKIAIVSAGFVALTAASVLTLCASDAHSDDVLRPMMAGPVTSFRLGNVEVVARTVVMADGRRCLFAVTKAGTTLQMHCDK